MNVHRFGIDPEMDVYHHDVALSRFLLHILCLRTPMRVAYITLAPFISGAERSLQMILQNCRQEQIEPVVLLR